METESCLVAVDLEQEQPFEQFGAGFLMHWPVGWAEHQQSVDLNKNFKISFCQV